MPDRPVWTIQLFGGLRIRGPETSIDRFPTRRAALLLARIALARSGSVGRDDLANALWPDDYLDATRLRLRQELNRLRETLGPAAELISSDRSWIHLDLSKAIVDVREFERLLSQSKSESDPTTRSKWRSQALEHYGGPLLPEQTEDWVYAERQDLQTKYLGALIEHTEQLIAGNEMQEGLANALRAVRCDPYHEPARRAAITAFASLGDLGGALRQYADFEKALLREYSVKPSESLQQFVAELSSQSSTARPAVPEAPRVEAEPLRTRRETLPTFLERLVGREEELRLLGDWLTSPQPIRLAVITGPGGVGKTRLAVAAASRAAPAFADEVVYVGLSDLEPGQRVMARIQEAFGFQGVAPASDPLPHWGDKRCLLVIDNAEHVLEDVRRAAKQILLSHSGICILATSRQKLGLGGEQELPLAPLAVPDLVGDESNFELSPAAQLFLERARAVRPGYSVPRDQLESFVLLLDRLDGLPLSIELAAARVAFMNPDQMLNEIDDRFTFLVSRRTDVEARQRSLRATIDWSFRGLEQDLREMLGVIAVFRGGCTLEFVRKATLRSDTIDVLQDLVERSLVQREESSQGMRFNMLESIRHYVLAETPAEKVALVRADHAAIIIDHVYQASRNLGGLKMDVLYETIRLEMENARSALDWALEHDPVLAARAGAALWRFWTARGRPMEGAEYLDRIFLAPPDPLTDEWAEAHLGRGAIAAVLGQYGRACECHEKSAALYWELGSEAGWRWAKMNQAFATLELGQNQRTLDLIDEVIRTSLGDAMLWLQNARSRALARLQRNEEAMAAAEETFANWVSQNNPMITGRAYHLLATVYGECGRYEAVHGLLQMAVESLKVSKVQDFLIRALRSLAQEELRLGNLETFEALATETRELANALGDTKTIGLLDALEARKARLDGNLARMARLYESAIVLAGDTDRVVDSYSTALMASHDFAQSGHPDLARSILSAAEGLRAATECGRTQSEQAEAESIVALAGEPESVLGIATGRELATKILALTAEIR